MVQTGVETCLIMGVQRMYQEHYQHQRISAALFKRCFFIGLAVLGTHLLIGG